MKNEPRGSGRFRPGSDRNRERTAIMAKAASTTSGRKAATRKPAEKREWHLVCVTRKGKVSMLQNLTLTMARETYKRLRPDERPERHIWPEECVECGNSGSWVWSCGYGYTSSGDGLERVDVIGPPGKQLDPWHGVKPIVIDMTYRAQCGRCGNNGRPRPDAPKLPTTAKPAVARWDRKRTDFWNHPRLWDRVKDTHRQPCWEMVR